MIAVVGVLLVGVGPFGAGPSIAGRVARDSGGAPVAAYGVGEIVVRYRDPTRRVHLAHGRTVPRELTTLIRYPAAANASAGDQFGAAAAAGPFPLIVFAHGFDSDPGPYAPLLRAWVQAGYVVAAPIFPRTNHHAPGGADEDDLVNQPADLSLVITRILAAGAAPTGILSGRVSPDEIAVAGHSDGGSTALAAAYNSRFFDSRIRAAIILAGAHITGVHGYTYPPPSPPLLAVMGTADTSNQPRYTLAFFRPARQPKYLLTLIRAAHEPPYTYEQPQLGIVERTSTAFLDRYLQREPRAGARITADGDVSGISTISR